MLIRISLIIAILAALAVGALNFVMVKEKITTLVTQRDEWQGKFTKTDEDLRRTKGDLDKTAKELATTKETLDATTTERDKALAEASAQSKRAGELNEKLTKTTQERDTAQQELAAFRATGFKPEQIIAFGKQIKDARLELEVLAEEKKLILRRATSLQAKLDSLTIPDSHGPDLPAALKGKVLVADPKWDFVVLDVGEDEGVLEEGQLLVSRNGKLVAKIRVRSVQKGRSIGNVIPGWKIGDVMEGDQIIAAYPAS